MRRNAPQDLRENATDAERRLWALLPNRRLEGYKFRRQHPIGPFIADFACTKHKLVIEADGSQHFENPADDKRTAWLERHGWRVIRFWNPDILTNSEGILTVILEALAEAPSPASLRSAPSPAVRERGNRSR